MNLLGVLDISGSALTAERIRAEVIAVNMANAETTKTPEGGPYRRREVVFMAEPSNTVGTFRSIMQSSGIPGGVSVSAVVDSSGDPMKRYDPHHPDADKDGYVSYPDINPLTEMVDLMDASRAYTMNVSAVQAEKSMITSSLEIGRS